MTYGVILLGIEMSLLHELVVRLRYDFFFGNGMRMALLSRSFVCNVDRKRRAKRKQKCNKINQEIASHSARAGSAEYKFSIEYQDSTHI